MTFSETWLPNIVCGLVSIGVTYWMAKVVTSKGAERTERLNHGIIRILAEMDRRELVTDKDGLPTGGQVVRLSGGASGRSTLTANLTTGPATVGGNGTVAGSHAG